MHLDHIIGYGGLFNSNIKWSKQHSNFQNYPEDFTSESSKFLIYPAGNILVYMNPVT
jgi:hypothetical protein